MTTLITVIHIITSVLIVMVVLVQSGKGAEVSASFGGSSQTVFGSTGGSSFFTKFTWAAAGVFVATSIVLTILGGQSKKSVFEGSPFAAPPATQQTTQQTQKAPAAQPKVPVPSTK